MRRRSSLPNIEAELTISEESGWDDYRESGIHVLSLPELGAWAVTEHALARRLAGNPALSPSTEHWGRRTTVGDDSIARFGLFNLPESALRNAHEFLHQALAVKNNTSWLEYVVSATRAHSDCLQSTPECDL